MFRWLLCLVSLVRLSLPAQALEPIPDRLVVLTFDDSSKSHYTVARPLLKKLGFGATFFITEGFDFPSNKRDYMTWEEITQLHRDGFEIGNHTGDHQAVTADSLKNLPAQLRLINERCKQHGIPVPVSFAYPGNSIVPGALPILKESGIRFARRGGSPEHPYKEGRGFAYEPALDHPLLLPSAGDARPDWKMADFERAVQQARHGRICVLQFHGVPDTAHSWVNTSSRQFTDYMNHLADNRYKVIAMRDLARYVDPTIAPSNPLGVIEDRQSQLKQGRSADIGRPSRDDRDLDYWLRNMTRHGFRSSEMAAALNLSTEQVEGHFQRLKISPDNQPVASRDRLEVLPYPGGRHPRAGFLDGAIRPQRETKFSVFPPWADGGYAVVDVPEAIWFARDGKRELLYLAHTHVPTTWDRQRIALPPLEWVRGDDGSLRLERSFPNGIVVRSQVIPGRDGIRMELSLHNGSDKPVTDLVVQMCTMLKELRGFESRINENKVFARPFAACRDASGRRWIITGWQPCVRAWGNPPCPCLHSDPRIPDCPPGESRKVVGWLSFYEGDDIRTELRRLEEKLRP